LVQWLPTRSPAFSGRLGNRWRPAVYKLYAESFKGRDHLRRVQTEAQAIIERALRRDPATRPGGGPHWTNVQ